jgi:aldehyde:ferredoxin oxidoreductase
MIAPPQQSYGWTGVSAVVDLTLEEVRIVPTAELRGPFPGGRAAGQLVVSQHVPRDASPLDPQNLLVLGAGPLVGTAAPASSRVSIDTKGLTTGGVSSSNAGGHWAPELKYAGFDMLVVEGRAKEPTYLLIEEGRIAFRDATHLWGSTTWETETALRQVHGDQRLQLLSIGPAGERMSPIACIMVDRARAAGHGGCGGVMGSKNLKAVACRGGGPIRVASPESFMDSVRRAEEKIAASRSAGLLREGGTHFRSGAGGFDGTRPTTVRNSQDEVWTPERAAMVREPVLRARYEVARLACFNCSMYCSHYYHVTDGPFAGLASEGVHSNTVRGFGSNLDVTDPAAILQANALCNQYGLDVDGASNVIAWAFELYQRGILTRDEADGLDLRWGDPRAVVALLERVCHGEGIGALLQLGAGRASKQLGRDSAYYALTSKGHDLNESAMRSHKGWALGIMTSARGGGHLNGAPSTEFARLSSDVSMQHFGVTTAGIPQLYEGKPEVLVYFERLKAAVDAMGMCYFTSQWTDVALLDPSDYASLYSAATGDEVSTGELMRMGEQVVNLERALSYLHAGYTRENDYPPERLMRESIPRGDYAGERLDRAQWDRMLDRYYALHSWDAASGLPTEDGLRRMGLTHLVQVWTEGLERL